MSAASAGGRVDPKSGVASALWEVRPGRRSLAEGRGESAIRPADIVSVVGYPLSVRSLDEHVSLLIERASAGVGLRVVTLNLEMLARAAVDRGYAALLRQADLFVADGVPLIWLSRLVPGRPLRGRTNGTDLVQRLLTDPRPVAIGVLGGLDPQRMLARLEVRPGRVVFLDSGRVEATAAMLQPLAERITAAGVQVMLVGLGVPKQDQVCAALRALLPQLVLVPVGGSFDLLAGLKRRAPAWMQRAGLEWVQRLVTEPRRLGRRYLLLYPRAIPSILGWVLRRH